MGYNTLKELPNEVVEKTNVFRCAYKHPKSSIINIEDIDLSSKFPEQEFVSDIEALEWWKNTLTNFNNTLRPGEKKRNFWRCYRLTKIKKFTEIK